MKRYKVVEQIWDTVEEDGYIKSMELNELVLEEVKEEKESGTMRFGIKDFCEHPCCKDQPLTPKDVGMRKGEAMYQFVKKYFLPWLHRGQLHDSLNDIPDEEFDRLFQEFLKEQLNNK